jgi:hypothetical protein
MIPGGRTGATSRLSPISGCGLFHQRLHTQQITHSLSNRFGNNSRDAANRTLARLPVQPQITSDSRHLAFVHVNPRNTQQLPEAVIAVPDADVFVEERVHHLRRGHYEHRSTSFYYASHKKPAGYSESESGTAYWRIGAIVERATNPQAEFNVRRMTSQTMPSDL